MEEEINTLKDLRAKAKRKVTGLIRKLTASLQYGDSNASTKEDLEREFDLLFDLNLQVEELEDQTDYLVEISKSYDNVMKLFFNSRREDESIKKEKESSVIKHKVERNLKELSVVFDRLSEKISKDCSLATRVDFLEVEEDKAILPPVLDKLLSDCASLGLVVEDMAGLEGKVDEAVSQANKLIRDANIFLKLSYSSSTATVSAEDVSSSPAAAASVVVSSAVAASSPAAVSSFAVADPSSLSLSKPMVSTLSYESPAFEPKDKALAGCGSLDGSEATKLDAALSQHTVIHTKKPSLPFFSGERADWPEFRCVWRSLAEAQFANKMQLAMELKRCCKGKAAERIRFVYVTNEGAYDEIWDRLYEEYDDPALSSQEAINQLLSLRPVEDHNFGGMVKLIDIVDGVHNQLRELGQLHAVHAVDVDRINTNLPRSTQVEWLRTYRDLSASEKMAPFPKFVTFLRRERASVARMVDNPHRDRFKTKEPHKSGSHLGQGASVKVPPCAMPDHGREHTTENCPDFRALLSAERFEVLKKANRCFMCFGVYGIGHRSSCTESICSCGKRHHKLLCPQTSPEVDTSEDASKPTQVEGYLVDSGAIALYPICPAFVKGYTKPITVFLDGGSNASYVTSKCTAKYKLRQIDKVTLNVTTVGGENKEYLSSIYEVPLTTANCKVIKLTAYELPEITGKLSCLDKQVLAKLFPDYDPELLLRKADTVDILIGTDYFGLHPKNEVARAGANLSIMRGELGVCVVGTHPSLQESTILRAAVPRTLHVSKPTTNLGKLTLLDLDRTKYTKTTVKGTPNNPGEAVVLKKKITLFLGVAIIVGIIIGSGIFVSPVGILKHVKSMGFSMVRWAVCCVYNTLSALGYAELGASIPESGGIYVYIRRAFGDYPAFVGLWINFLLIDPGGIAAFSLMAALYILQPNFPDCAVPALVERFIAIVLVCLIPSMKDH